MFNFMKLDKENTVVLINQLIDHLDILQYIPLEVIQKSANVAVYDGKTFYIIKMRLFVNMMVSDDVYNQVMEKDFKVITPDMVRDTENYTLDMLYGDYILFDITKNTENYTRFSK